MVPQKPSWKKRPEYSGCIEFNAVVLQMLDLFFP
jgi:hypothetical protein